MFLYILYLILYTITNYINHILYGAPYGPYGPVTSIACVLKEGRVVRAVEEPRAGFLPIHPRGWVDATHLQQVG